VRPERHTAPARAEILAATTRLLTDRQLHEISVQQILAEAGISRPTFYSYFESKLEVVSELYSQGGTMAYAAMGPMYQRPDGQSPAQAIRDGLNDLVVAWIANRAVFHAAVEHRYTVPALMTRSQEEIAYFCRNICAQLERDRTAGVAPPGAPSGPLVTTMLWSTEHALYIAGRGLYDDLADEHAAVEPLSAMWLGALYGIPGA
jgi:AcrR family transcriptional regulator